MIFTWTPRQSVRDGFVALVWTTGGTSILAPAKNLFGAIRDRIEVTADLIDNLPGGVFQNIADYDGWNNPPFAVVTQVADLRQNTAIPGRRVDNYLMQIAFFGTPHDDVAALAEAWHNAFNPAMTPLQVEGFNGHRVINLSSVSADGGGMTPSGDELVQQIVEFRAFGSKG